MRRREVRRLARAEGSGAGAMHATPADEEPDSFGWQHRVLTLPCELKQQALPGMAAACSGSLDSLKRILQAGGAIGPTHHRLARHIRSIQPGAVAQCGAEPVDDDGPCGIVFDF